MSFDTTPEHLNDDGKAEWARITRIYRERGMLDELHYTVLEAYCAAYGEWRAARRLIRARGQLVKDKRGNIVPNPAVEIERREGARFRALVGELRMVEKAERAAEAGEGGGEPVTGRSVADFLGLGTDATKH